MSATSPVDPRSPEGVYAVQFPDRVKVGRSSCVPYRIVQHWTDGALRATGFRVEQSVAIEDQALAILRHRADQIGRSESFTGISFEDAIDVLRTVAHGVIGVWPETIVDRDRYPMGNLTERIRRLISEHGEPTRGVQQLSGISERRWNACEITGEWRYNELGAIAGVLRMPVERLIGLPEVVAI